MANFIDKFNVNTAITDNTKMDLGHQHITTANFMQMNPALIKEMVPGETVSVNMMTFTRMQPLAVPTMGRANIKERSFFVPMRTIFKGWNDFITDTPHIYSGAQTPTKIGGDVDNPSGPVNMLLTVPTVSNKVLLNSFAANNSISFPSPGGGSISKPFVLVVNSTDAYDVIHYDSLQQPQYLRFTSYGRQWLKVLESLGYKLVWNELNEDVYSALPLFALCKVFIDWYFPSAYVNTGIYVDIAGMLNSDTSTPVQVTGSQLNSIARMCLYVNYDSDYFVSAWDNPNSPNTGVYSNFRIVDIDSSRVIGFAGTNANFTNQTTSVDYRGVVTNGGTNSFQNGGIYGQDNTSSPVIAPFTLRSNTSEKASVSPVSEYLLHGLHALTDYMKRHQLVGARALDRYLARFGKSLSAEKMNRCNYISSKLVPLQIGDVYSTSNAQDFTSGVTTNGLGQFAGKGMAFEKDFTFEWSTDEFGYLIILTSIVPAAGIWQGLNRQVMHKSKMDFWTPEFDNLGVQAISTRELYNGKVDDHNLGNAANSYCGFDNVFGFAPRYGEYKYYNDQLTGDLVLNSLNANNANTSAWHLMRTFDYRDFYNGTSYDYTYLTHSRSFMSGLNDHYQYNRIFTYFAKDEADQPDPFTVIYDFNMVSFAPMKPLYETYEFEDKGKKVQEQVNGVKLN